MFGLGLPEILLILVVILLIFGAQRLPEIGHSLGQALREFKKAMSDHPDRRDKHADSEDQRKNP